MLKYLNYLTLSLCVSAACFADDAVNIEKWQLQSGKDCSAFFKNNGLILNDGSSTTSAAAYSRSVKVPRAAACVVTFDYSVETDNKKSPAGGVSIRCYDNSGKTVKKTSPYHLHKTVKSQRGLLICKLPPEAVKLSVVVQTYQSATGKVNLKNFKYRELNDEKAIQELTKKQKRNSHRKFPEPGDDEVGRLTDTLPKTPFQISPSVSDRQYWNNAAEKLPETDQLIEEAKRMTKVPFPKLDDALYLEYATKGLRSYRKSFHKRTNILQTLVLAECFEAKGRFLEKIETYLNAVLDEKTWVLPAHDKTGANFKRTGISVDLGAVARASLVTATRAVLQPKLSGKLNERIVKEVYRKVLTPYAECIKKGDSSGGFFWVTASFNWNAFCSSNIAYCAASLPDIEKSRDYIVAAALKNSEYFLAGFPEDGYCSEGIGYWSYGFGNFLLMAEILYRYSNKKINLFQLNDVKVIAGFARKLELHDRIYPAFADCPLDIKVKPFVESVISSRITPMGLPEKNIFRGTLPQILCSFEFFLSAPLVKAEKNNLPECSRFDTSEVIVLRDTRQKLSLAVKAGHNNEYHNHNDVGSYVLLLNDMLVNCDPGLEAYTSRTFSKRRYESDLLNSRGHAVPLVAGRMQGTGKEFKGKILKYSSENGINEIVIDLKPAYDVDGLEVLERKIVFNRKKRVVSVCDTVKFKSHSKFGTALITYQNIDVIGNDKIIIKNKENSVAVNVSATGGRVNIKSEVIKEKPGYIDQQPFRVGIDFIEPVKEASITVTYHL